LHFREKGLAEPKTSWHALDVRATAEALATDAARGLSPAEAESRLVKFGRNALPEGRRKTLLGMFLGQFKDFLVLILVAAAAVSLAVGEMTDAGVILAILILNACLGVAQERRAGRALEALKKLSVPECEVLRDGATARVASDLLVPGDLVVLREGAVVPADLRIVEAHNLRIDEAGLTGESEPVEKDAAPVAADLSLADRANMAYAGTVVTYGRGRGLVVATGLEREIGRIAQLLAEQAPETTPLQQKLAGFGKLLGVATLVICGVVFLVGIARGPYAWETYLQMFMTAVSLAVAAVPEGLPAIVTVVLALGVYRMSRHHAIVRKLPAVETLGCATYICTDKTGTLTENRMTVVRAVTCDDLDAAAAPSAAPSRRRLIQVAVLCNDAHLSAAGGEVRRFGDPTELALVDFARTEGVDVPDLRRRCPRLAELPFDSQRKRMSTLHDLDGAQRILVKGAPDLLLALCHSVERDGRVVTLDDALRARLHAELDAMAGQALRVLAFAWKEAPARSAIAAEDESDLVLVGLVGMRDSPRPEARAALEEARRAGIHTIMITGDNLLTARTIAGELGMLGPGDEVIAGRDLEALTDEELSRRISRIRVFARVWPEQKMRIVRALQARGEVVAMTGDGVNDAPALKKSDIGVAMGVTGTDVAKEAADVVLLDDNFATIVKAIEEGRVIFDNIRKFIGYLLACNVGETLAVFLPVLAGLGSPLVAAQILLVNLVTDGLPALALGVDAPGGDVMRRKPRPSSEGILTRYSLFVIGFNAVFVAAAVIVSFIVGRELGGLETGRTMAFVTLCFDELLRAFSFRSRKRNLWQIDPRTNLYLVGACAISAAIVLATVLLPPLRTLFSNASLDATQWAWALALSLLPVTMYELWKVIYRRRHQ
jgi:Ca2+-transporting ATPase